MRARPLMDELHRCFNKTLAGLSRKSDTAAAIRYALSRWHALSRYLDDGSIEIDNSAADTGNSWVKNMALNIFPLWMPMTFRIR